MLCIYNLLKAKFVALATNFPLSIKLKKEGFRVSKNNTYCIGLISSLFDVNKNLLINYNLCKNERSGLIYQMKYLYEGDILLLDRGYYSRYLLSLFNDNKIDVIFRMKKNSILIKKLIKKGQNNMYTKIFYNKKLIRFRILTYEINDKKFFLGTTIMNHKINYFKNLYWKRWNIEIHFRESKYLCSLSNILSKNKNAVLQNICAHIRDSIMQFLRSKNCISTRMLVKETFTNA